MDYTLFIKKIEEVLKKTKFGVLATSTKKGIVSATQMCIVSDGLKLYFQTDESFEKVKNIKENSNVAINVGAYYFKGKAKIIGHPLSNERFIELIKKKHPETYESYTLIPSEILIEVELTECKKWGLEDSKTIHNQNGMYVVDLVKKKVSTIVCDTL